MSVLHEIRAELIEKSRKLRAWQGAWERDGEDEPARAYRRAAEVLEVLLAEHFAPLAPGEVERIEPKVGDWVRNMVTGEVGVLATGPDKGSSLNADSVRVETVEGIRVWSLAATETTTRPRGALRPPLDPYLLAFFRFVGALFGFTLAGFAAAALGWIGPS